MAKQTTTLSAFAPGAAAAAAAAAAGGPVGTGSAVGGGAGASLQPRIQSDHDLRCFLASPTFNALWAYLLRLAEAATSTTLSAVPPPPPAPSAVAGMGTLLCALDDLVAEVPPGPTTVGRYGNAAFREWRDRAARALPDLVRGVGVTDDADVAEVVDLLGLCWGNATRLDYGSGHEAAFLVVLFVLSEKLKLFPREEDVHLPLTILPQYLTLTRALQSTYNLEPAGSHGVWGLDDFAFLPYLFGAAQLVGSSISPAAVCSHPIPPALADDYLYFDAVAEIYRVKGPGLSTHSPMLYDVSGAVGGWTKVAGGMVKMYRAEVWGKRVVVQHLGFGRLFEWTG